MRLLFSLLLVGSSIFSFAQKVSVDDSNNLLVDGKIYGSIIRENCGGLNVAQCQFTIKDTSGKKQILVKFKEFNDYSEKKPSNPDGRVTYFQFIFIESKQTAEIDATFIKTEKMARYIIKNELIKDGALNKEAVDIFVLSNGNSYSKRSEHMH